ncbi:MAG: polysaccharide biosynthesis protein [Oscillospiraceae bacterium]|nr:polysaccharide biosynthesis protein [Oscillospiraceae bacterium]
MSQPTKKQTFLHGAALLAIATAVVKVIGFLYKIPLSAVIGNAGYGYFTTAYNIYSVLLMISTAGLPVAMSRMISQASSLGNNNQVRRIYAVARSIFLVLGMISTAIMVVFCRQLANWLNQPDAWAAILCLGPCALLMGMISTYRGFFQGQGDMRPTSNSQMLEAVFKLVVGLAAAFVIMYLTADAALAAGGAILGVTVSCLVSVFYLRHVLVPAYRGLPQSSDTAKTGKETAKELLAIAVPITIGSAGLQLLTVAESGLYMKQLVDMVGSGLYMSHQLSPLTDAQAVADNIKGIYDQAFTIFNMPCAFIIPITVSVIPAITSHLTLKNDALVRETEESAARITGLLSLPCAVGLMLLGEPVMGLLWGHTGQDLVLGGQLMSVLGISIFLYAIIQYTNALMQAHGYAHIPVINMLLAGVVRLVVVYILVGNPNIGMLGAPLGVALCYGAIAVMNLIAIAKVVPQKPKLMRNLLRPLLPAIIMGLAVYGSQWALERVLGTDTSRLILCGGPIAVGVVVYCVAAVLCKSITAADCALLPKGEKIAKLLKLS